MARIPLLLVSLLLLAGCAQDEDPTGSVTALPPAAQGDTLPVQLDLLWCVKDDASASQMAAFAARVQTAADALWTATRGQMAVRSVILVDRALSGHVVLENLGSVWAGGTIGGGFPLQAWLHELGHAEVLKDWTGVEEYALSGSPLPCAMGAYVTGSGDGEVQYCDASSCLTSRAGCWETLILPTHPNWTYPRTPGPAPAVNVVVQDN
jgi:hypothetical protein